MFSNEQEDILGIADWLRNRPQINKVFVSIILCTDDEDIETSYRALEYNPRAVLALNRGKNTSMTFPSFCGCGGWNWSRICLLCRDI